MRHIIGCFCFLSVICCKETEVSENPNIEDKAREIHKNVITIDTHDDIDIQNFTDSINYTQELETQVDLPKMKSGDLNVAWFIVYTGQDSLNPEGYARAEENALSKFNAIHRLCDTLAPDEIKLARTSEEVRSIFKTGKRIAMIGVENAYPVGEDLEKLETYQKLGARYVSLAHNGHSQFCDSHTGEENGEWLHNGLSELGKNAVYELNRLGIMIDISHVSKQSMIQILSLSKSPVIASHSSARALCDHSRNLDDEQLKLLRQNGGVVQTVALDAYLNTAKYEARESFMKAIYKQAADSLGIEWFTSSELDTITTKQLDSYFENYPRLNKLKNTVRLLLAQRSDVPPEVDVSDFVDHIDYMVNLIGINHVGISSDFDGGGGIKGWSDASETFNVTLELVKRGYSEAEIEKLWGGNLLRVLDEVQEYAVTLNN